MIKNNSKENNINKLVEICQTNSSLKSSQRTSKYDLSEEKLYQHYTEMPLRSKGTQIGNYLGACWKQKLAFSQLMETLTSLWRAIWVLEIIKTLQSEARVFFWLIFLQTIVPLTTGLMIIVCVMTKHTEVLTLGSVSASSSSSPSSSPSNSYDKIEIN